MPLEDFNFEISSLKDGKEYLMQTVSVEIQDPNEKGTSAKWVLMEKETRTRLVSWFPILDANGDQHINFGIIRDTLKRLKLPPCKTGRDMRLTLERLDAIKPDVYATVQNGSNFKINKAATYPIFEEVVTEEEPPDEDVEEETDGEETNENDSDYSPTIKTVKEQIKGYPYLYRLIYYDVETNKVVTTQYRYVMLDGKMSNSFDSGEKAVKARDANRNFKL